MIRPMQPSDLARIAALEEVCFPSQGWSEDSFRYEIESNPCSKPLVLETEEGIAGYAIVWILFEQAQVASIAVDPAFRKRGYGQMLLDEMIRAAREEGCEVLTLEVRPSNLPALEMYRKAGFAPLHTSKGYYSDGEDALVMGLGI